jgi:hypothetical protein
VSGVLVQNVSKPKSTAGSDSISVFFQSLKLNAHNIEATHLNKEFNVKELLREQGAELLNREENFDSCEIYRKQFFHGNNLSGHASGSSRETTSLCEMCVTLLNPEHSAVPRSRVLRESFSCKD